MLTSLPNHVNVGNKYRKRGNKKHFSNSNISTIFAVTKLLMKTIKVKTESVTTNFIDKETGEILEVGQEIKHHKIVVDTRRDFVMMHIPVIGLIDGLDNTTIKVLIWCGLNASYNANTVNLTKPMCEEITKEFKISYQTIKNSISKLSKQKALIPMGSGTYRVNPRYFWKGQTSEKLKTMKYILEVECPNC